MWEMILDNLLQDIDEGEIKDAEALPSENAIAARYGVSRYEVRKVYDRLTDMGFAYAKQGKGRFCHARQEKIELLLSGDTSFTKKMQQQGYQIVTKNLYCNEMTRGNRIRQLLELESDDRLFRIVRLRIIEDEPAAIHVSYVSDRIFNQIEVEGPSIHSMFDYFKANGYQSFSSKGSELETRLPTKMERKILDCPSLIPVMALESQRYDQMSGVPLEVTKIVYRGDRFIYRLKRT